MRFDGVLRWLVVGSIAALGLLGCSASTSDGGANDDDGEGTPTPTPTPEFPEGTGQPAATPLAYPSGPYGIKPGSIIANYPFVGFINAAENKEGMQLIQLADFYNPTGTEVFPEGSLYGSGAPKPKALLIDVSSVWCGPCNYEADQLLPGEYAKYKPRGGEFLLQLADGPDFNKPADPRDLDIWTRRYDVNYPSAIDPSYKLGALFDADAFPANLLIKTQDMSIVMVASGVPDEAFWRKFEDVLEGRL